MKGRKMSRKRKNRLRKAKTKWARRIRKMETKENIHNEQLRLFCLRSNKERAEVLQKIDDDHQYQMRMLSFVFMAISIIILIVTWRINYD